MTIKRQASPSRNRGAAWLSLLTAALLLLLAPPADAVDSCSLSGVYVVSAAIDSPPGDQYLGTFTFTAPGTCTQAGTVSVAGSLMVFGQSFPAVIPPTTAPYTVDAFGVLAISPIPGQSIMGRLGHLVNGIAQSFVFIAQPSDARFAGVAVKQDFAAGGGTAGPPGPPGAPGPGTGATVVMGSVITDDTPVVGPSFAICQSPKVVLGGGALISTTESAQAAIKDSYPLSPTVWSASALVITNTGTVTVISFAICGNP